MLHSHSFNSIEYGQYKLNIFKGIAESFEQKLGPVSFAEEILRRVLKKNGLKGIFHKTFSQLFRL